MSVLTLNIRGERVRVCEADWISEKRLIVGNQGTEVLARPCDLKWSILRQNHTSYVVAYGSKPKSILLHRLIAECPVGKVCDHKNGDGLDNTSGNIRVATVAQNNANHRPRNGRQFAGVSRAPRARAESWIARVSVNGSPVHVGTFGTEMEAVIARDEFMRSAKPEFGYLNLPLQAGAAQ
jgi:hypothetical protein